MNAMTIAIRAASRAADHAVITLSVASRAVLTAAYAVRVALSAGDRHDGPNDCPKP